jgi:cell division protein FtsI (penicillin-binding protein 3)
MRRMMQGIVTEGTGENAALNGYSAGGKTGTAQKIDVLTHTYSKTKYVASFAGMAPVSSPAITVAVVIDSPSAGGSYYGAQVSAPVFQQVAQEVLEYLGVPHDQPLKTPKELLAAAPKPAPEEASSDNVGDLNAMFEQANNLPADDPLRTANAKPATAADDGGSAIGGIASEHPASSAKPAGVLGLLPAKVVAAFRAGGDADATSVSALKPTQAVAVPPAVSPRSNGSVMVDAGLRVAVPSFAGAALRAAVETAERLGLRVAPVGSGVAREQMPAAGTLVPVGTQVVVRFER